MIPFFPLWGRDFLAGTAGWTAEERGHYIVLLINQWEKGFLEDDPFRLELMSPGVSNVWGVISVKFPVWEDGYRRNRRLEHERAKAMDRSERARQSASARWNDSVRDPAVAGSEMRTHMPTHSGRTCSTDASRTRTRTRTITEDEGASTAADESWKTLRLAWNAGVGANWRTQKPPAACRERLSEDGWLEQALKAIERLPRCRFFTTPVSLYQFCRPEFVDEVLNGRFDYARESSASPPPPRTHEQGRYWREEFLRNMTDAEYRKALSERSRQAPAEGNS